MEITVDHIGKEFFVVNPTDIGYKIATLKSFTHLKDSVIYTFDSAWSSIPLQVTDTSLIHETYQTVGAMLKELAEAKIEAVNTDFSCRLKLLEKERDTKIEEMRSAIREVDTSLQKLGK